MNLSSKTTYIYPFLLLYLSALTFLFSFDTSLDFVDKEKDLYLMLLEAAGITVALFFLFKVASGVFSKNGFLKYILIILPLLIFMLMGNGFNMMPVISGLLLFYSYYVFSNRFTGTLTDETIQYRNIFGQSGVIYLKDISKLEQKRSLLSIFRELKFLNVSAKTGISFMDENLDEYEVHVFMKAFRGNNLFARIIENANKCGNTKARQYTY